MFLAKLSNKTKNLNILMFTLLRRGNFHHQFRSPLLFFVIKYSVLWITLGVKRRGVFCLRNDFIVVFWFTEAGVISIWFFCTVCKNVFKGRTTWKTQNIINPWRSILCPGCVFRDIMLILPCWQDTEEIESFFLVERAHLLCAVHHLYH